MTRLVLFSKTLLVLFLAWSAQQHWTFCRYFLLVYNSFEVAYYRCICFIWVIWEGETTEETEP